LNGGWCTCDGWGGWGVFLVPPLVDAAVSAMMMAAGRRLDSVGGREDGQRRGKGGRVDESNVRKME
jgi:hypothetical protein